jgi:hypothetical protein
MHAKCQCQMLAPGDWLSMCATAEVVLHTRVSGVYVAQDMSTDCWLTTDLSCYVHCASF